MPITSDEMLLSQGLVEFYDPVVDAFRQTDVETAKRIATVNQPLHDKLVTLGVITLEEPEPEE